MQRSRLRLLARGWLCGTLLIAAAGCSAEGPGAELTEAAPGALRGQLVVHVIDRRGRAETRYALRLPSGEQRRLRIAEAPEIEPGAVVEVQGLERAGALEVTSLRAMGGPITRVTAALTAGQKKPVRRWALVLVDIGK